MKQVCVLLLIAALLCGGAFADPAPTQTPTPLKNAAGADLQAFSGQILDYQGGFLFFTTGDGYRVSSGVRFVDAASGQPTALRPRARMYARAGFEKDGTISVVALSNRPIPQTSQYEYDAVKAYAVKKSVAQTNPDTKKHAPGIEGLPVLVTFIVTVPPNTPVTDQVYIATDKSGWLPNAIRMDRIDAMRYRYTVKLLSGTELDYLFTRGTWTTVERAANGLEQPPHHIFVNNLDVENRSNQVYYWADQPAGGGPSAQATFNPAALPTPYNPSPFNFPKPGHYGTPGPFPTPLPRPT